MNLALPLAGHPTRFRRFSRLNRTARLLTFDALEDRRLLAAGDLDPTFGVGGLVTTDFVDSIDQAWEIALQADGKIVVAGVAAAGGARQDFALARYNSDGSLDTTFDGDGKVTTDFGRAFAVALQTDGKIVAAGDADGDFALARYNSDGSLDTSFGVGGLVATDVAGFDQARSVAIQDDGKIVVAGGSVQFGIGSDFALVRYNTNGTLDTSFDGDGKLTTDFDASISDFAFDVAVQIDGKIVVAGRTHQGVSGFDFALARYNINGTLDMSFDGDGKLTTDFVGGADEMLIQPDGKIVAAGSSHGFALARYNSDGSLDPFFDGDGLVTTVFPGSNAEVNGLALQADGKIVAAGLSRQSGTGPDDFALARYNSDGSLDTTFGSDGKVTTDFGSAKEFAQSVALQADGKIVAVGSLQSSTDLDFALARYIAVSSQEQIESIIANLQALVPGALSNGQGTSLLAKLQGAIQQLDSDNETPAINLLQAFVMQVDGFIQGGTLTSAQGQPLIDAASAIIDQLSGSPLYLADDVQSLLPSVGGLTQSALKRAVDQAISYWAADGRNPVRLDDVDIRIADIPGSRLGVVGSAGTIWIDRYAAGYGWSLDAATNGQRGIDLLSVVTHELGHVLGFDHDAMGVADTLEAGTRQFPQILRKPGDADRNGVFDRRDITTVLQAAKYQTGEPASWLEGDWNWDGVFNHLDIVAALQSGRYDDTALDEVIARLVY